MNSENQTIFDNSRVPLVDTQCNWSFATHIKIMIKEKNNNDKTT